MKKLLLAIALTISIQEIQSFFVESSVALFIMIRLARLSNASKQLAIEVIDATTPKPQSLWDSWFNKKPKQSTFTLGYYDQKFSNSPHLQHFANETINSSRLEHFICFYPRYRRLLSQEKAAQRATQSNKWIDNEAKFTF